MSHDSDPKFKLSRRFLLGALPLAGAAAGLPGSAAPAPPAKKDESALLKPPPAAGKSVIGMRFQPMKTIRMGIVGTGGRGTGVMRNFLACEGVQVNAVCDLVHEKAVKAQAIVQKERGNKPEIYSKGDHDFENLCKRDDIDLIMTATSWDFHVPVSVCAMENGKHAAVEVPCATTLADCWKLVDTSEKSQKHCIMLENCCYGEWEMLVLNMVRAGVFGDLIHGACAYNHDLRSLLFANQGEGLWRRFEHVKRDANLYPTHGLGPVAQYMNINRGDRFVSMVSMSSAPHSLAYYRDNIAKLPADDPRKKEKYLTGDMNISLIRTAQGRLIRLEHNVSSPMPYDRVNVIAGVKGIFMDYPPRIYVEGRSPKPHVYETDLAKYQQEFGHPLWKREGDTARKMGGHGGMDFIEAFRLIECMKEGIAPDIDVYDSVAWSAPTPISEMSINKGCVAIQFPDFTRGRWKERKA